MSVQLAVMAAAGIGIAAWQAWKFFRSDDPWSSTEIAAWLARPEQKEKEEEEVGVAHLDSAIYDDFEDGSESSSRTIFSVDHDSPPTYDHQHHSYEEEEILLDRKRPVAEIQWKPPPQGWVKVNSDGGFSNDRGTAGGLIRDERGKWLGGFVLNIGSSATDSAGAELWGLLYGLVYAWKRGFKKVIAEIDSKDVVYWVNERKKPPRLLRSNLGIQQEEIWESIIRVVDMDWWEEVKVQFKEREANYAADYLAFLAKKMPLAEGDLKLLDQVKPPKGVKKYLHRDIIGPPYARGE